CAFPGAFGWISPLLLSKILVAVTGISEFGTPGYLWRAGERVYNLERSFNIRDGFSRKDDTLPKRFLTEPLKMQDQRRGRW
ncbi:MAG: aldehyde ferredoxin oxidoreductase C-terminal domain-containing protein, partial [Thermodesulfobacteriota bacterium]|nr:aldehyde ferredoxin oxidoreductase C-terminal domain-containing protein [Thermodesulfobacteriota bacterium]